MPTPFPPVMKKKFTTCAYTFHKHTETARSFHYKNLYQSYVKLINRLDGFHLITSFLDLWQSSGGPKGCKAGPHTIWESKGNPRIDFLIVIAGGWISMMSESHKMAAILQL